MGDFKQQFNNAFQKAPSFSTQAREKVKRQLHHKKKKWWIPISAVAAAAVALVSFILWNDELLGGFNEQLPVSLAAPEHENKMEIFSEITTDNETHLVINNMMYSMNRGKEEYVGNLVIETKFNEMAYGQVVLVEEEKIDNAYRYALGRVIGKPGDKVAIENGQLYLNDLPIETFYGKAHVMGTTDVEEAFERLKKASTPELKQSIEKALRYSLEPYTLQDGELFIVSDNWARNSVRKPFTIEQIEGVVIGYSDESNDYRRELTEEELTAVKARSEEVFKAIQNQDKDLLENLSSELFSNFYPYNDIESMLQIDFMNISDEVVEHYLYYYSLTRTGTGTVFSLRDYVSISYKVNDRNEAFYLFYVLEDGKWKFADYMYF